MHKNLIQQHSSVLMATENTPFNIGRWLQVLPLAAMVTFCLLVFMERLIAMADVVIEEESVPIVEDVFWEEPIIETRKEEPPKKPEDIEELPERPPETAVVNPEVNISIPKNGFKLEQNTNIDFSFAANIPIAQYLAAPRYPAIAIRREINGYVDVMFDVTEFGGTDNVHVVRAEPEGIFEKAAINAVTRWRFQPKVHDDKPVRFEGMVKRVRFEMEKP